MNHPRVTHLVKRSCCKDPKFHLNQCYFSHALLGTCFTCLTSCSVAGPTLSYLILYFISCRFVDFSCMLVETWCASSHQGSNCTLRTAYFICVASTCARSYLPSCNLVRHCAIATMRVITRTSSYYCWRLWVPVFNPSMLRSSCRAISTSMAYSNNIVQSTTVALTVASTSLINSSCCSLTSGGVEGYDLSSSYVIFNLRSNWIRATYTLAP